jgi:hypothetical protein
MEGLLTRPSSGPATTTAFSRAVDVGALAANAIVAKGNARLSRSAACRAGAQSRRSCVAPLTLSQGSLARGYHDQPTGHPERPESPPVTARRRRP